MEGWYGMVNDTPALDYTLFFDSIVMRFVRSPGLLLLHDDT